MDAQTPNGLNIGQKRVPMGVIGIIMKRVPTSRWTRRLFADSATCILSRQDHTRGLHPENACGGYLGKEAIETRYLDVLIPRSGARLISRS